MSLQQAIDEIRTRLDAITGLQEVTDLRDETLDRSSMGGLDGAYNLKLISSGNPWPELDVQPASWYSVVEMELATVMTNSHVDSGITEATRTQAIREALHYTPLTYSTVWGFDEPLSQFSPTNPRLRLWRWRFNLRYQE